MDFINMNDWIIVDFEESSSQSLLVIMASKSYTNPCFLQFWKGNFLLWKVNF